MTHDKAFNLGYEDFIAGQIHNPFCALSDEGKAWFNGWNQAHIDEKILEKF